MIDLQACLKEVLITRASTTEEAVYAAYKRWESKRFSRRLGASILGHECERRLWLGFRWASAEDFEGRLLSLFEVGHWDEDRMARDLRRAGLRVETVDRRSGGAEQYTFTYAHGHGVCKIDGALLRVKEAPKTWHVWEHKTINEKGMKALEKKGMKAEKPLHHVQVSVGMGLSKMKRGLYTVREKASCRVYMERLRWEDERGTFEDAMKKAERIVFSSTPPMRISNDSTFFKCRFCPFTSLCHSSGLPLRNCRTCLHSTPTRSGDGAWLCERVEGQVVELTNEEMLKTHNCHRYIPQLVPYSFEDVDGEDLRYEGWIDRGPCK